MKVYIEPKPKARFESEPIKHYEIEKERGGSVIIGNTRLKKKHMNLLNDRVIIQFYVRGLELRIEEDLTTGGIANKDLLWHKVVVRKFSVSIPHFGERLSLVSLAQREEIEFFIII